MIPFDPSSEKEGPEAIKNSQVHQQSSDLSPKRKRKRLVKESHLPHLPRGKSSSRVPSEGICAVASKGKGGLSVSASLSSRALVAHESGITYQLNEESTPASIAELLCKHVFGASFDISNPRLLGIFYHLIGTSTQAGSNGLKPVEELFADSNRQALLV